MVVRPVRLSSDFKLEDRKYGSVGHSTGVKKDSHKLPGQPSARRTGPCLPNFRNPSDLFSFEPRHDTSNGSLSLAATPQTLKYRATGVEIFCFC